MHQVSAIQKHLYVIFMLWSDNNKESNLIGFAKHYDTRIIVKVLLSINVVIKFRSVITAIQHQFTMW